MTPEEISELCERVIKRTSIKCRHSSGEHIWNCHRDCQWCGTTQERYEAAVVAETLAQLRKGLAELEAKWREELAVMDEQRTDGGERAGYRQCIKELAALRKGTTDGC